VQTLTLHGTRYTHAPPLADQFGDLYVFPGLAYRRDQTSDTVSAITGSTLTELATCLDGQDGESIEQLFYATGGGDLYLPLDATTMQPARRHCIDGQLYAAPVRLPTAGDDAIVFDPLEGQQYIVTDNHAYATAIERREYEPLVRVQRHTEG
jgi:hypothetical protein